MQGPKVFISYSWSTPDHENWVLELATKLRHSGVDAVLDKWDLKEGHDAYAFMEKMVSDDSISKVIIISDKTYAEKSDLREGGAGTEAQIISAEIYTQQDQDKFVVAVTEIDETGEPYVPTYYKGRIFINFTSKSEFDSSFEQLVRWVLGRPIHKKPEIGRLPIYITEPDSAIVLTTSAVHSRSLSAIKNAEISAFPATKEYMSSFAMEFEKFRLPADFDPLSDDVMHNLDSFIPYRDEFLEIVRAIAGYTQDDSFSELIHSFFEQVLRYCYPLDNTPYRQFDFDNIKFLIHELFLRVGEVLISERRFTLFNLLLEQPYYNSLRDARGGISMNSFTEFRDFLQLFEYRNVNLGLRRTSLVADVIRERCGGDGSLFNRVMEVDFLLFVRSDLTGLSEFSRWYPDTLVYSEYSGNGFELFQRAQSAAFFERIRPLLGGSTKEDLEKLVDNYNGNRQSLPRGGFSRITPAKLLGLEKLCTRP